MRTTLGRWSAAAITLIVVSAAAAGADEGRENELEGRVRELERQIAELRAQSAGGERSELEARVADLEKLTKKDKDGLFAYWKTGLRLDSADKRFKLKLGGRIMNDYTFWSTDSDTETVVGDTLDSGAEFRRVRMYMAGTLYANTEYKLQYDFADGGSFKDVYIAFKDLVPGTKVKVGHQYTPFGMEEQTSSKYITFIERGLHNTFNPSRQTGISIGGHALDGELNWRAGGFYFTTDGFGNHENDTHGEFNVAGRVAYRPFVSDEGDEWVHVGASFAKLNPNGDMMRYRQRPQVHIAPRFVNTDHMMTDDVTLLGLEAATAVGPFHAMAEYTSADVDRIDDGSGSPTSQVDFDGLTLQAGVFLTGESRGYKGGNFSRTKPNSNWGDDGGSGAVELAARYSTIDLDDADIHGGKMDIWSLGLNWYLNPNTRIMLGYEMADLDRKTDDGSVSAGDVSALTIRFQIDF